MSGLVVVGAQWGDEGKAKVIDYLSQRFDIIVRFQGGANAGHTVMVNGKKFVFHMVPSGIMYPDKICVIGNGVVFDAEQFLDEVDQLEKSGINTKGRIFISDCAHLVVPYHKILDKLHEQNLIGSAIGTTGKGIGPAYADKINRVGIHTGLLQNWNAFSDTLAKTVARKEHTFKTVYGVDSQCDYDKLLVTYKRIAERIVPLLIDSSYFLFKQMQEGKHILFEGAQGALLDIDHGTYPFVTSSNTIAGGVCTGAGVSPRALHEIIGIVKAYTTRVGNGPFPTELFDENGDRLRKIGNEFGSTTGRPRRCGWFDSVVLRKACQINGLSHLALTKLDVLNEFSSLFLCTHYEYKGKKIDQFPSHCLDFENVKPVYLQLPGWNCDISGCKRFSDLPSQTIEYIHHVQHYCYNLPLLLLSVGADRSQTIPVDHP